MATREFEFKDATSDKFWKITLDGKSHTVHFGRRGTAGQQQTKEFGSDAEAQKSHDKLVAEKVGKGYVETTSGATTATPAGPPKPKPAAAPKAAPATPAAPAPAVAPAVPVSADRKIDLDPLDWAVATWRPRRLQLPAPRPFDRDACLAALRKLGSGGHVWALNWGGLNLPLTMSPEEAQFWFSVALGHERQTKPAEHAERLKDWTFKKPSTVAEVGNYFRTEIGSFMGDEFVLPIWTLVGADGIAELFFSGRLAAQQPDHHNSSFLAGYRRYVAPHLTPAQADSFRDRLRPKIVPKNWPTDHYVTTDVFKLAAALGMHAELRAVVESIPEGRYGKQPWDDHYHDPQTTIFGLESAALVEQHVRRLKLVLRSPEHVRGWLAHTEWNALDVPKDGIVAESNRDTCEKLVDVLHAVHAPEMAAPMLEIKLKSKAAKGAGAWFEANPVHTAAGLASVAGGPGAMSETAIEMLRTLQKRGTKIPVDGLAADVAAKLKREVVEHKDIALEVLVSLPDGLAQGIEAAPKKFKVPGWAAPDSLPPLLLGGKKLGDAHVVAVLATIQAEGLDGKSAFLDSLRERLDPASRDAFAWKLCERWLAEGADSKEKWALHAVGRLGGDESVLKLAPLIRVWPGEAQHARAVLGLEVLRCVGSDAALMQLNGIAQKLKFQGLKNKAREFMEAIAEAKGLTRSELEDRIVPDCDLDERGTKVFEAGGKTWQVVLGPEMKPMVKDAAGKLRPDLPDSAGDELSAEWKLMKKQIKEVAAIQAVRLEQAMVTGRRWKAADFDAMILKHPLMTHLARLLVWGVYDAKGKVGATFRATPELDLADAKDEPFKLPDGAQVGLVHPLQLDEESKRAWGKLFADYELAPPFLQMGRGVHPPTADELKGKVLKRFDGTKVPAPGLVYTLEKLGWVRGMGGDGGGIDEHSRQFPGSGLTVFLNYEGAVGMGYIDANELVEMKGACFLPGMHKPSYYGGVHGAYEKQAIPLKDVDPIVLSETIHDLQIVAAKGAKT